MAARFEVAAGRLAHFVNHGALNSASEAAYEGGLDVGLRVGPFGGIRGLSKLVHVRFADPITRNGSLTVAVRWEAAGTAGELFPVLDADLTLTGDGDERTRLRLDGSYRPPLGRAGAALDRVAHGPDRGGDDPLADGKRGGRHRRPGAGTAPQRGAGRAMVAGVRGRGILSGNRPARPRRGSPGGGVDLHGVAGPQRGEVAGGVMAQASPRRGRG